MPSTASLSVPGVGAIVAGRYEVRDELGHGAQGRVLEALDRKLGRLVALKILPATEREDAEALQRFHAEARAAARLRHPGIVTVYDTGEGDGFAWMAMELVIGQTLRDALRASGRQTLPEALRIMRELLDALDAAHARGVVHRDVKPSNILLAVDAEDGLGAVRLADFGIASMAGIGVGRAGDVVGTPAVMAPEQIRGEAIDHRVDLWSAGIVFYELVTGTMPFVGSLPKIYDTILHREPLAPSLLNGDLPSGFDAVLARALDKDPERRFQSAREMQGAIAALAAETADIPAEVSHPPIGGAALAPPPRRLPPSRYGIGLALAFLTGAATGVGGLLAVAPEWFPSVPSGIAVAAAPSAAMREPVREPEAGSTGATVSAALPPAVAEASPAEPEREPEAGGAGATASAALAPAVAEASPAETVREPEAGSTAATASAALAPAVAEASPSELVREPEAGGTGATATAALPPSVAEASPSEPAREPEPGSSEAAAPAAPPTEERAADAAPPAPVVAPTAKPLRSVRRAADSRHDPERSQSPQRAGLPPADAPACQPDSPQVATGNHPRFGRFVLRWSQPTAYRVQALPAGLRLDFDAQPCITLPEGMPLPRNIRAVRAGPGFVEIDLVPGSEIRHFTLDRRTVVDAYD